MTAINSSIQWTDQSYPGGDNIEAIKTIKNQATLEMVYLKPTEEESWTLIKPEVIREMKYHGKSHIGV